MAKTKMGIIHLAYTVIICIFLYFVWLGYAVLDSIKGKDVLCDYCAGYKGSWFRKQKYPSCRCKEL